MVFWSSFSKKIKQAVSQISFDALKRRVDNIETSYATKTYTDTQNQAQDTKINANTTNITTNTNNITALDNKVDGVITGLKDGNVINYTGVYNAGTTYRLAQAAAYNDLWYVSNVDNNIGHTPTGVSDAFWERISAPVVNLQPYLLKTDAANIYLTKTDAQATYASITTVNGINTRLTTAEQNINNLNTNKANNSDVYNRTQINNWNLQTYRGTMTKKLVGPQRGDTTGTGGFPIYKYAFETDIRFQQKDWSNMCVLDFRFVNATRQWTYIKPVFVFSNSGYIAFEFITMDAGCYQTNIGAPVEIRVIKNSSYIG